MKHLLFLALITIMALGACKKRSNVNGDIKNRREILVSRNWQMVSRLDNGQYSEIKDCQKDNYFVFEDNGLGRWEEGTNNCFDTASGGSENPTPATYTSFTWSMSGDQRDLHLKDFEKDGRDPEWMIVNMDYNSMDIRWSEFDSTGYLHTFNMKFKAL